VIITVFRSRLRRGHEEEYTRVAAEMKALASAMPGFVSMKTFTAEDGERVSIVEFASQAGHDAWREHPRHREAQRLGREKFYSSFRIQVCRVERDYTLQDQAETPP
jgi:heme-degrading monooxygenase HmoA